MDILKDVKLIEYPKRVEQLNCITHAFGALLAVTGLFFLTAKAINKCDNIGIASCIIYGITLIMVYTFSAVYHGLPMGEKKRVARLLDHLAIPLLLAGTATPCALISLKKISSPHAVFVFVTAWLCALFGIAAKIFFFEKLKAAVMVVYFTGGTAMMISAIPLLWSINKQALLLHSAGCIAYAIGSVFCNLGIRKPKYHVVFHIFILLGSAIQFFVIYNYVVK